MATEIIPGIYRIEIPLPYNPPGAINIYLLTGNDGYLLIDTGWNSDEAFATLVQELNNAGIDFKDIKQIVITHAHPDHYGLVGQIKQLSDVKIYMHHKDEEILRTRYAAIEEYMRQSEEWFNSNGVPHREIPLTRISSAGTRPVVQLPKPDFLLNGGETISTGVFNLKIIWTPGHSPGHICLYEPGHKLLFAGDHVLPTIIPNISLPPSSTGNPLTDFLKSLDLIRNLDVTAVLPAHENIFHDLKSRIDAIIKHRALRNDEIMESLSTGSKTAYEISNLITWMPESGGVRFRDLLPMDQRAAVSETLAHLRALTITGRTIITVRENVFHYECSGK